MKTDGNATDEQSSKRQRTARNKGDNHHVGAAPVEKWCELHENDWHPTKHCRALPWVRRMIKDHKRGSEARSSSSKKHDTAPSSMVKWRHCDNRNNSENKKHDPAEVYAVFQLLDKRLTKLAKKRKYDDSDDSSSSDGENHMINPVIGKPYPR